MRTAGTVFVAVAALVVAGFWLVPIEYTVLGSSVNCGAPVANLSSDRSGTDTVDSSVVEGCEDRNRQRVVIGLVLGAVALIAGLVMLRNVDDGSSGRTISPARRVASIGGLSRRSSSWSIPCRIGITSLSSE